MRRLLALLPFAVTLPVAAQVESYADATSVAATIDGAIGTDEYGVGNEYTYFGGGSGFGGGLGNAQMFMKSSADTLFIGFSGLGVNPSSGDQYLIYFNTRPGGFQTNGGMSDTSDGGRANVSRLSRDGVDTIAFDADFALLFGQVGTWRAFFTLAGTGQHVYSDVANARVGTTWEFGIPLSLLGVGAGQPVDFQMFLISGDGWLSNEGIPNLISATVNGAPITISPGHDGLGGSAATGVVLNFPDFSRFTVNASAVPEPAHAAALVGLGVLGLALLRRRR